MRRHTSVRGAGARFGAAVCVGCLMAAASAAQARYRDGMNLYAYVDNSPPARVDPSGLEATVLERDRPAQCAKCPCAADNHDCSIEISWLAAGDSVSVAFTGPKGRMRSNPIVHKTLSRTRKVTWERFMEENFPVVIRIKSASGKDVRDCHLRQDVTDWWYRQLSGNEVTKNPPVEREYGSQTHPDNVYYGGWWLHDAPRMKVAKSLPTQNLMPTHWFFQMEVAVEENPKIRIYYGGHVQVDYEKAGADKDAVVERKQFGPVAQKQPHPFVKPPATQPATQAATRPVEGPNPPKPPGVSSRPGAAAGQ